MTSRSSQSAAANLSAVELVEQGFCSPQCLIARDDVWGICQCRCEGTYHGLLADVQVEAKSSESVSETSTRSGCPDWCQRDGEGTSSVNHVATVARLRKHDGIEIEVTASREQRRDDGVWGDPDIIVETWNPSDPGAGGLRARFCVSEAWEIADIMAIAVGGDGWLPEALRHASSLFGPTHESGLGWVLWDNGMRPRDDDDYESDESAQGGEK